MKVLLIGGSGFIGSRLTEVLLDRGHDVTLFDRQKSARYGDRTVIGDVRDEAALTAAAAGFQVLVDLAAEHRDDVRPFSLYEEVNVGGARTAVAAATAAGIDRIVFTSSVAVYGLGKVEPTEDSPVEPFNEYGRTKFAAEGVFRAWAGAGEQRTLTIVRPSVVFGEGNRGNVYTLARQIAAKRFLFVGPGANRKSMSYVGNIAAFLADAVEQPAGVRVLNYADKPDLSTKDLVEEIKQALGRTGRAGLSIPLWAGLAAGHVFDLLSRVTGRTFPVSTVRIRKFCAETTVGTAALEATGFQRPFTSAEALRRTIAFEFPGGTVPPGPITPGLGSDG